MFARSIPHYDRIYAWKDYAAEVARLEALLATHRRSPGRRLLDVACGTGRHLALLAPRYEVEGLDLSEEMLALARERCPGVPLHRGDMTAFDLGRTYDVVTCLFSSIGYAPTVEALHGAARSFARHLVPGGVAVVEPWFPPGAMRPGHVSLQTVDEPDLKICRVTTTVLEGPRSVLDMHHLVGTPAGTEHFVERHVLTCFTEAEMRAALEAAGLETSHDREGFGRGLWIARRPDPD